MNSFVSIILLNYKNWQDTVACLFSLNQSEYRSFEVVVVDNGSGNDSLEHIKSKVAGQTFFNIVYLDAQQNLGFAAGNNLGLKHALTRSSNYFWILNNDTEIAPDALQFLVTVAELDLSNSSKVGLYGSKLRYFQNRELLQAVGGYYNKWWGYTKEIGNCKVDRGQYDRAPDSNILIGAAIFTSRQFLLDVGLMGEDYFLYYEEHDWVQRARQKGWTIRIVAESMVFHKQGASIKANGLVVNQKSRLSDFYSFRNKLLFTWRYFPYCLPTVYVSFVLVAANRVLRKQWDRLPMLINILIRFRYVRWKG